jgi:hypothetical protein
MTVDRAWVQRNLGFDPVAKPPPAAAFANAAAATPKAKPEDIQREIIDFDSEGPEGREFLAFSTATGLSRFTDIPWPKGLAPVTGKKPAEGSGPLPRADVLVVTWTTDEGHALSRVLTPGKDSHNDYVSYMHNFAAIARTMRRGCPALELKRLGAYWRTSIGGKKVVVFKSDSHLSQDTKKIPSKNQHLPNYNVWKQIIDEVRPKLVLTTGTGGGIGKQFEVGDVIVSPLVRFDCQKWLKNQSYHDAHYDSNSVSQTKYFATAKKLFKANSDQLPKDNKRPPKIVRVSPGGLKSAVVTTDFFGFDTSNNYYHLWGYGDLSEMGDAILGMVAQDMGKSAPRWVCVRNVSDPEIKAEGTLKQQAQLAAHIYKGFGRWSSVCSAIVCWALIAAL